MPDLRTLATVPVPDDADYWFLGGTIYRTGPDFSMAGDADITYPYTTYYRRKIEPFRHDGIFYRPLAELVLPLLAMDTGESCTAARLDPAIMTGDGPAYPFIGYDPDARAFRIVLPDTYTVLAKDAEWLGTGTRLTRDNPSVPDYAVPVAEHDDWQAAVRSLVRDASRDPPRVDADTVNTAFHDATRALSRSWDARNGTFLQLPWRDRPGFALDAYSYGLLAHEAERLALFTDLADLDGPFRTWRDNLIHLFTGDAFTIDDLNTGDGTAWYNTLEYDGTGLHGSVYLGTGYYGYPGGQATIARSLLAAADRVDGLTGRAHATLEYLVSTQEPDGGWPKALHQDRELPFDEDPWTVQSEGATAECVRALLHGWQRFGDDRYRDAAERGLARLETRSPVCRNGLRDIGTDEPEGFSAFAAVHAFLDAHDVLGDDAYLDTAETYASYLLTWTYWSETGLDLRGIAHPISETITMRISPYETLLAAEVFDRLAGTTGDDLWSDLYEWSLARALEFRNRDGGLSEGVFFDHTGETFPLHTAQTFATAELVKILSRDDRFDPGTPEPARGDAVPVERDGSMLHVPAAGVSIDADGFRVTRIAGEDVDGDLRFAGPYTFAGRAYRKLMETVRGHRLLAGLRHADYLWNGVHARDIDLPATALADAPHSHAVGMADGTATFQVATAIHTVNGHVSAYRDGDTVTVDIPFTVHTRHHDVPCTGVTFALPGFAPDGDLLSRGDGRVALDGGIPEKDGFDLSLAANWTHGGVYHGTLSITVGDGD